MIRITPSTEPAPPLPIWQGALFPGLEPFNVQQQRPLFEGGLDASEGKTTRPGSIGNDSTPLFEEG